MILQYASTAYIYHPKKKKMKNMIYKDLDTSTYVIVSMEIFICKWRSLVYDGEFLWIGFTV